MGHCKQLGWCGPVAVAALTAVACGHTPAIPPGFVELEEDYSQYDSRATTADGVVLATREIDNSEGGTAEFWTQAVENQMRRKGGYALLDKQPVKTNEGITGIQLRFGLDQEQEPHVYYVTLLITEDTIHLLEAGGTKAQMERYAKQIEWSVRNFRE